MTLPGGGYAASGVWRACWKGFGDAAEPWVGREQRSGEDEKEYRRGIGDEPGIIACGWHGGAGVAGTSTIGVAVEEMKAVALGWSAKKQILDKDVYNDKDEKVGKVEDLIVAPDKAVSYVIVGVGGFLGLARHDVAIPAGQLKSRGG